MAYEFKLENLKKRQKPSGSSSTPKVSDAEIDRISLPRDERYVEGEGFLTSAINAIDYVGNISRSAMYGGLKGGLGSALDYAGEAATQKRHTGADQLKNEFGIGNVGRDDGKFQWGDVVDFGADLAVDIATDPLTYASFGTTKLAQLAAKLGLGSAKAGKAIKTTDDLAEALGVTNKADLANRAVKAANRADNIEDAAAIQRNISNVGEPLLGAAYGAGLGDQDDSLAERLAKIGVGAAGLPAAKRLGAPVAGRLLKGGKVKGQANDALESVEKAYKKRLEKRGHTYLGDAEFKKVKKTVKDMPDPIRRNLSDDALITLSKEYDKPAKRVIQDDGKVADWFIEKAKSKTNWLKGNNNAVGMFGSLSNWYVKRYGRKLKDKATTTTKSASKQALEPPEIDNMVQTFETAREAAKQREKIVEELTQGRVDLLESAGDIKTQAVLAQTMGDFRQWYVNRRLELWDEKLKRTWDKVKSNEKKKRPEFGSIKEPSDPLYKAGIEISRQVQREARDKLKEFSQIHGIELHNKAVDWLDYNLEFGRKINKARGVDPKTGKKGKKKANNEFVALEAHIPFYRQKQKEFTQLLTNKSKVAKHPRFKAATEGTPLKDIDEPVLGLSTGARQLTPEKQVEEMKDAIQVWAHQNADHFLTKEHRQALKDLSRYYNSTDTARDILKGYDRTTNWMKANILFGSNSWLTTNLFDNLGKAYMSTGVYNALDVGLLGLTQRKIGKDVWDMVSGKVNKDDLSEYARDALEFGFADTSTLRALHSDTLETFFRKESKLAELLSDENPTRSVGMELLNRLKDGHMNLLQNTVGKWGTYAETYAKVMTYKHTLESLKKSKALGNRPIQELKELSAQIAKDTFFDYRETIGHFEQSVMKRVWPFYSFYKMNAQYYGNLLLDPERLSRLTKIQAGFDNIGDPVDSEEFEGLPSYLRNQNPRSLGRDKFGKQYAITPGFSAYDALRSFNPGGIAFEATDKISPVMKTAYEIFSGRNLFTEGELYPSNTRDGKSYLFSRGFIYKYFEDLLKLTKLSDDIGVEVDRNGNPISTSDWLTGFDKIAQITPLPGMVFFPAIARGAGAIGKMEVGREGPGTAAWNVVSPLKRTNVTNRAFWFNKRRRQQEKYDERREELRQRLEELRDR